MHRRDCDSPLAGDSLPTPMCHLSRTIDATKHWLEHIFPSSIEFTFDGLKLDCGRQADTCSCGIATYFTLGHAIFGEDVPKWMPEDRKLRRVEVFVTLVNIVNDSVRTSSPCLYPTSNIAYQSMQDEASSLSTERWRQTVTSLPAVMALHGDRRRIWNQEKLCCGSGSVPHLLSRTGIQLFLLKHI